jgi:hypothetical protein
MKYSKYGTRGTDRNKILVKSERKKEIFRYRIQFILTSNPTKF